MSNPTGNYSIIKVWGTSDTILAADLNAEFNNVLNSFNPEMLAAYSQNQAQMQIQTNPGGVGSESLATSIAGELERLRYQINSLQGTTYWYQTPAATIAQLNSALGAATLANKVNSGATTGTTGSVQPMYLIPANTTNTVTVPGNTTPLSYTIAGVNYVISSSVSATSLTVAPNSQNTCTVNDLTLAQGGTQSTQLVGENGSQITVSSMGTSVSSQTGNICAFKTTAGEYLIGKVESTTQITQVFRGYFFNSANALVSRGTLSNGDTLTIMKLTWIFANTVGAIAPVYTNPKVGGIAPSSPATGDYWFDTSANIWKSYNSTTWVPALATLIGICIQDTSNTVAARSLDFFAAYNSLNTLELWADQQNDATVVRARYAGAQVNVYGTTINYLTDYATWNFTTAMDTGAQTASTMYYFYVDTNGRSWISKVAPLDRRADLQGYYHPGLPWRCLGYGFSNSATQLENVESFFKTDTASPVSNITTSANNIILPYNILQQENIVTLSGAGGAFTQVLPPPAQLKGKTITYIRTDGSVGNLITIQSWGTAAANPTGTQSTVTNQTKLTGLSSTVGLVAGQLVTGVGIPPNTTLVSIEGSTAATISAAVTLSITNNTFNFANSAFYSGTVGQQTNYVAYGVNGQFTTTLATQYETVTITSDGYAYYIVNRRYPSTWQNFGTISITGGTVAKGTVVTDRILGMRVGNSMIWRYEFMQSTAGATGTGLISLALPANYQIDINQVSSDSTGNGFSTGTADRNAATSITGGSGWFVDSGNAARGFITPKVLTATTLGGVSFDGTNNRIFPNSASSVSAFGSSFGFAFTIQTPMLGWSG